MTQQLPSFGCSRDQARAPGPTLCRPSGPWPWGRGSPLYSPQAAAQREGLTLVSLGRVKSSLSPQGMALCSSDNVGQGQETEVAVPFLACLRRPQFCPLDNEAYIKTASDPKLPFLSCKLSPEHPAAQTTDSTHDGRAGPSMRSSGGLVSCKNVSSHPNAKEARGLPPRSQAVCVPLAWLARAAGEGRCAHPGLR